MRTFVRRTLCATAIAGGFTVLGIAFATSSASAADTPNTTSGASGIVSGNQTDADATAPIEASGNQVTVIGDGNTSAGDTSGGDTASGTSSSGDTTTGEDGTGSGNQTDADATAPIEASGNQVTVIGDGNTSGGDTSGGNTASGTRSSGDTTTGEDGTGSGNQTDADATAPIEASGNQVTVIGDGNTSETSGSDSSTSGNGGDTTTGEDGTGSGNQTTPGATAPIVASDNQVTIIGDGNTQRTVPAEGETSEQEEPGTAGGSTETAGPAGGSTEQGKGSGATSAAGSGDVQAGPAAPVAGVLPATGSSAALLLWAILALAMMSLGMVLVARQRGRGLPGRLRTGAVTLAS